MDLLVYFSFQVKILADINTAPYKFIFMTNALNDF